MCCWDESERGRAVMEAMPKNEYISRKKREIVCMCVCVFVCVSLYVYACPKNVHVQGFKV